LHDDNIRDGDHLLSTGLERSSLVRLAAQLLDFVHQLFRLSEEGVSQLNRPSQVSIHLGYEVRELRYRLDVVIPRLVVDFSDIVRVPHESRRLHYFQGIDRGRQQDGNQGIRMERDWQGELLQVSRAEFCRGRRGRGWSWGGGLRRGRDN